MDTGSPHHELASLINRRFANHADSIRNALREALDRLEPQLSGTLVTADDLEGLLPAGGGSRSVDFSGLRNWVTTISEDRSQVGILKSLLQAAQEYATRACLFVVRGDNLAGWGATGFTGCGSATDEQVKAVSLSLGPDTVLSHVVKQARGWVGGSQHTQNDILFEAIGNIDPVELAAFPLINRGRVAAVLYVDSGNSTEGIVSTDAVDILSRTAMTSIELRSSQPAAAAPAAPAATPTAAAHSPAAVPRPTAAPQRAAAPAPAAPAPAPAAPAPNPAAPAASGAPDLTALSPEDRKLHEAARRFARLLVSEIKLYNEAKVVAGRKERDLYVRLREDIDRSKQMYDQRVNPKIAQTTNYFRDELVNTLAEGDASLLSGFK